MCRIFLILASIVFSTFINCYAEKLGTTPSMLVINGNDCMQIDVENVQTNVPFNTFVSWIGNDSYADGKEFQGSMALAMISEKGDIKELIHEEKNLHLSPGFGFGQTQRLCNVKVTGDISDTDILCFITLEHGDDTWCPVVSKEGKSVYCKVRGNEVRKSKITVNILGQNEIPYECYCIGTSGETRQYDPIYLSFYGLFISWPSYKNHHYVKVDSNDAHVQIDPDKIYFQSVSQPEYTVTLMACSDDELITEQRHFYVENPGSFAQQLKNNEERLYINNIAVSGKIDETDIAFMRDEMPMLEHIDLSSAEISGNYLPDRAFEHKNIKTIVLPKNLKGIGANSLSETKLFQLDIPESVDYYGLNAFNYSQDLTLIVLHNPKVIPVSWCVLNYTNRSKGALFVPEGTREAFAADEEWGAFGIIVEGDNTADWISDSDDTYFYTGVYPNVIVSSVKTGYEIMEIPEEVEFKGKTYAVTGIGDRVFSSNIIREIYIPKSIMTLGENAISSGCRSLTKIQVDEDNPKLFSDNGVLYDRMTSTMLTYPAAKGETEYFVPEGIIAIGGWACYNRSLRKISFPSTLQNIGSCAFSNTALGSLDNTIIISKAKNPPRINPSGFGSYTYANAKVYVPTECLDAYKTHPNWSSFYNIYPLTEESGVDNVKTEELFYIIGNTVSSYSKHMVEIYTIDGKLFYIGNDNSIDLPKGMYIIRIDEMVKKIKI